jgi:hypothetical protein
MMEQPDPHWMQLLCGWFCFLPVVRSWLDEVFWEVPISSLKGEVKKKHNTVGWIFSCFAAHLCEQDLF